MDQNGMYTGFYSAPPTLWQRIKKPLIALSAVFLVVLLVIVVTLLVRPTPEKVSAKFVSLIQKNKATDSYAMFSSNAKKYQTQDTWAATVSDISPYFIGKNTFHEKRPTVGTETKKTADWTIAYFNSSSKGDYLLAVRIVKEKGDWKVESFSSAPTTIPEKE